MEFAAALKAYLEVGILGLCAVVLVVLFVFLIKKLISSTTDKDKNISKTSDTLIQTLIDQNNMMFEAMKINNETFAEKIIKGVTTHVPSVEENERQTKISEQIDNCLGEILTETNADRANLVQYHNGGQGVNKQKFLKMSMTNEKVIAGVTPAIYQFKDQFRSTLAYFTKSINDTGKCYISNVEDLIDIDPAMYDYMKSRNLEGKFGVGIVGPNNYVLGFISIEFTNKHHINIDNIQKSFDKHKDTIETLMNM